MNRLLNASVPVERAEKQTAYASKLEAFKTREYSVNATLQGNLLGVLCINVYQLREVSAAHRRPSTAATLLFAVFEDFSNFVPDTAMKGCFKASVNMFDQAFKRIRYITRNGFEASY
ncbi:hypothetical protein PMIN06_005857 [Paraphaeosphaeria minitans]